MPNDFQIPRCTKHKSTGQARVRLNGRDIYLGRYGSTAAKAEYERLIARWLANGRHFQSNEDITMAELIEQFLGWVNEHYRHLDGTPTSEPGEYKMVLRALNFLYGPTRAADFKPSDLKAVRQVLLDGYKHPKYGPQPALARGVINKRVNRLRRLFRWAVENDLIPVEVHQRLLVVEGLRRGRSKAKETKRVQPVPRGIVEETLPVLRPMVADMVRLQLETGMRPGELVIIRAIDIDMSGPVWLYKPSAHKTAYLDHERTIPIGPRGQEIRQALVDHGHPGLYFLGPSQ